MEQQTDFGYQLGFGRANVWLMQEKAESILSSSEIVGCLEAVVWHAHTHTQALISSCLRGWICLARAS
jgi:hypothetical protein